MAIFAGVWLVLEAFLAWRGMYSGEEYQELAHEPKLMFTLSIFVICTTIFLFNLLCRGLGPLGSSVGIG